MSELEFGVYLFLFLFVCVKLSLAIESWLMKLLDAVARCLLVSMGARLIG